MSKKLLSLVVLGLALSSAALAVTDINVGNHSFEYNCDGEQVQREVPPQYGCLMSWDVPKGTEWVGASIWCGSPLNELDPGDTGCSGAEASDGHVSGWAGADGADVYMYQVTDSNFEADMLYTLLFDGTSDPEENVGFRPQLFYGTDPELNIVASEAFRAFDERGWEGWTYDLAVQFAAESGAPCVGEPIGIRLFMPYDPANPEDTPYPFFDNIRLKKDWATCAYDPHPHSQEIYVDTSGVTLDWSPGLWTDKHIVYFSSSFADVNSRAEDANQGSQDPNFFVVLGSLSLSQTYYWAIDEVNSAYSGTEPPEGPWPGQVWSFTTKPGKASGFRPSDGDTGVPRDANLSWEAGPEAAWHVVYFSTSFDDVNSRAEDANQGWLSVDINSFDPTPGDELLGLSKIYYWAVDEVNMLAVDIGSPWRSDVLSFTSVDHIIVDDMDSYDVGINDIKNTWKDYYTSTEPTSAEVYLETFDPNLIIDGNSMRYLYRNELDPYYSEATAAVADLGFTPDWTAGSVETLVLNFRATADNDAEQMYAALTDGSGNTGVVLYDRDVEVIFDDEIDIQKEWKGFQEWNIALQDFVDNNSVVLTDIASITIGFGDKYSPQAGGEGTVYFDDIRLYPSRCVGLYGPSIGDFDGDCVIGYDDLETITSAWLTSGYWVTAIAPDSSSLVAHWTLDDQGSGPPTAEARVIDSVGSFEGVLYDGFTSVGDPALGNTSAHSTTGVIGNALTFDGWDDFIEVPPLNLNSNTMTITAWVRRDAGVQSEGDGDFTGYTGIVTTRDANTTAGLTFGGGTGTGAYPGWPMNNKLAYNWGNDEAFRFQSELYFPELEWALTAVVVEPNKATLYMSDRVTIAAATAFISHDAEKWDGIVHFAKDDDPYKRFFKGTLDDIRIYDRALSAAEIAGMAGLSGDNYVALKSVADIYPEASSPSYPDVDTYVNLKDYAIMAENWLNEILFPPD